MQTRKRNRKHSIRKMSNLISMYARETRKQAVWPMTVPPRQVSAKPPFAPLPRNGIGFPGNPHQPGPVVSPGNLRLYSGAYAAVTVCAASGPSLSCAIYVYLFRRTFRIMSFRASLCMSLRILVASMHQRRSSSRRDEVADRSQSGRKKEGD